MFGCGVVHHAAPIIPCAEPLPLILNALGTLLRPGVSRVSRTAILVKQVQKRNHLSRFILLEQPQEILIGEVLSRFGIISKEIEQIAVPPFSEYGLVRLSTYG